MTDKEVLSAMSTMLEPIQDKIQEIQDDLDEIKSDLSGVKSDLSGVKSDLNDVKDRVKRIELTQENIIIPRLNNIEACYTSTYKRYKNNADEFEFALKHDIPIMKQILTEHNHILQTTP